MYTVILLQFTLLYICPHTNQQVHNQGLPWAEHVDGADNGNGAQTFTQ